MKPSPASEGRPEAMPAATPRAEAAAGIADPALPPPAPGHATAVETSQAILDALADHIALVDAQGVILTVNAAWRNFARDNDFPNGACGIGQNYLDICSSAGRGVPEALQTAEGIRQVLTGAVTQFEQEYYCALPQAPAWFRLTVTPTGAGAAGGLPDGAVISHHNITQRKLAEMERQNVVNQLAERVKELRTLHEVTRLLADEDTAVEPVLAGVAAALRGAMQYSEQTAVSITCGGISVATPGFAGPGGDAAGERGPQAGAAHSARAGATRLVAGIRPGGGAEDGRMEVVYLPGPPGSQPAAGQAAPVPAPVFQEEEARLMHTVAGMLRSHLERRRASTALRQSEARMAAAQRIAHFGSWELTFEDGGDPAASTLTWSDETFRIAGYEPGAVAVTKALFYSLVPEEDQPLITSAMARALAEGEGGQYEVVHRMVRADGTTRVVRETARLFCDPATGRPQKMIGTVHDITEQRRAEEALLAGERGQRELVRQLQEERARLVVAQQVGKVGSWETDLATFVVAWSAETHRIFETDPATFQPTHDLVMSLIHPEDRDTVSQTFLGAMRERELRTLSHRLLLPDGRVKHVEQRWQNFFAEDGTPLRAIGTCQDITERREASEELARTAALVRAVVNGTPDAVFVKDIHGRYQFCNEAAARLVGRPAAEIVGRDDTVLFPPEEARLVIGRDRQAMAAGRPVTQEEALTVDGVTRTYLTTKASYHDVAGNVIGLIGISRDISGRKQQEHRLAVLSTLGRQLNAATTARHAAEIIFAAADDLFGWDAATLDLYSPATGLIMPVLNLDTIAGRRAECPPAYESEPPSPLAREIITHGPRLILRAASSLPEEPGAGDAAPAPGAGRMFGDTSRPSASLMFVPVREGVAVVGLLSIQSYRVNAYDAEALQMLGLLADYCEGALSRIQTESLRKVSEERFREMAENIGDVFYSYDPQNNQLLYANHALERLWRRPLNDFYANPLIGLDEVHPQDRAAVQAALARQMQGQHTELEFRVYRGDGTVCWVRQVATPILDPANPGVVSRIVGTMRDITESRTAADRLAEQAALLDKAQDAILVRDLDDRILYWNKSAERIYGWSAREALGRTARELLCKDPGPLRAATATTLTNGEWTGELEKVTKAGKRITARCQWSLVRDEQGAPKSILTIETDVTEHKLIEQQVLRSQRMESIGTLAGGIAHDLNNVLAPILMSIDLLRLRESDAGRLSVLRSIEQSARRGADMVRQVLSFARGVEGRKVTVEPARLLREIETIANETFLKNILVRCEVPGDLWTVEGDPTQLHQVLLNLCVNARDAMMPAGGTLALSATNLIVDAQYTSMHMGARPGPHVCLTVEDTGTGMPPEVIDRIFEPFFTTKELGKGTGLGLSTTLAIVKSHGGFLRVQSEPGRGTCFQVHLPARPSSARPAPPAAEIPLPRGNDELILVIDDEESVRTITRHTLEAFGYRVLLAADGGEAISLYASRHAEIAIVLTDMMMPLMDGPTLIQILLRLNPGARIIAASGLASQAMTAKAAQSGITHFLPKPYTAETLLQALQKVLQEA